MKIFKIHFDPDTTRILGEQTRVRLRRLRHCRKPGLPRSRSSYTAAAGQMQPSRFHFAVKFSVTPCPFLLSRVPLKNEIFTKNLCLEFFQKLSLFSNS